MKRDLTGFINKVEDILENKISKLETSLDRFDNALERLQVAEEVSESRSKERDFIDSHQIVSKMSLALQEFYKSLGNTDLYKNISEIVKEEIKDSVSKEDLDTAVVSITNTILVKLSELKEQSEFTTDFQEELYSLIKDEIKELGYGRNQVQFDESSEQRAAYRESTQPLNVSDITDSQESTLHKPRTQDSFRYSEEQNHSTTSKLDQDNSKSDVINAIEEVGHGVDVVDSKTDYSTNKLDKVESILLALSDTESDEDYIDSKDESEREASSTLQVTDAIKENTLEGKKSTNKWAKAFDLVTGLLKGLLDKISKNLPVIVLGILVVFRLLQKAWDAIKNSAIGKTIRGIWDFLQKLTTFLYDKVVVPVVNTLLTGLNKLLSPLGFSIPELMTSEDKAKQREQELANIRKNDRKDYIQYYKTLKQLDEAEANYISDVATAEREGSDKGLIHDNYLKTQSSIIGESDRRFLESIYGKQEGTRLYNNPNTAYRDRDYKKERQFLEHKLNLLKSTEGGALAHKEIGDYIAPMSIGSDITNKSSDDRVLKYMWETDAGAGHWEGEGANKRWVIDIPFEDYKAGKRNKSVSVDAVEDTVVRVKEGNQIQVGSASTGVETTIDEGIVVRQTPQHTETITEASVGGYIYEDDLSTQEQSKGGVSVNSSNTDVRITNITVTKSDSVIDYIA